MATIEQRGPFQFRVKIRRGGITESRTFESRREAQEWALVTEGRIVGDDYQDQRLARRTTLGDALEWFREHGIDRGRADAKNKLSKIQYWLETDFARWSLVSVRPWDLVEWRRGLLDEDSAEDGGTVGPKAACSPQTVIHRLNVLSQVYQTWSLAHRVTVANPVIPKVRPPAPRGRDRRLRDGEEARLLAASERSSRPWLKAAIVLAIATCTRQAELAGLTWDRVHADGPEPHVYLPKTKNDRARTVPLSTRAVAAFRSLRPEDGTDLHGRKVFPIVTPRGILHAFRDVATEREFPDLRWHDLRHEGISRLFETTDLRDNEIMAITGHLRPEMLRRYTHLRTRQLAARLG